MIRLLADENFDGRILRGLLRRVPDLDVVRAQDVEDLLGAPDPILLAWAADPSRVMVTHDVATMAHFAYRRVLDGESMPGVFEVRTQLPAGLVIEQLMLLAQASQPGEWEGQVLFLPL